VNKFINKLSKINYIFADQTSGNGKVWSVKRQEEYKTLIGFQTFLELDIDFRVGK